MSNLSKRKYVPHSHFVRAALDFLDNGFASYQGFGTLEEHKKRVLFKPEWKQLAFAMVDQGLVERAYLHVNQKRSSVGGGHLFVIKFQKRDATGLSPHLDIPIKTEKELQERAAFHRSQSSLRAATRNPRTPPINKWEKSGGPI